MIRFEDVLLSFLFLWSNWKFHVSFHPLVCSPTICAAPTDTQATRIMIIIQSKVKIFLPGEKKKKRARAHIETSAMNFKRTCKMWHLFSRPIILGGWCVSSNTITVWLAGFFIHPHVCTYNKYWSHTYRDILFDGGGGGRVSTDIRGREIDISSWRNINLHSWHFWRFQLTQLN